ncbi:phosphotransferase enzyme family protein [Actinoplanes aureus]|uniref:Phosphotransferase n=1 Tax=Actinoplanes aureus TaxID=2792083 RepID=A0A931G571_9ACTN|nr:phosphotransferase [Actinoplanes aureus]MBG0565964.1 phosphotransferase [Actinoplanes aureus]
MNIDADVCRRWRLEPGPLMGDRGGGTWAATRGGPDLVVKRVTYRDVAYTLRVAAALREQGWPTPELVEEPLVDGDGGTWLLLHRLPGVPRPRGAGEQRARGRLLAEFHESAAASGLDERRDGFAGPAEVVGDPALDRWLREFERFRPEQGRFLRECRDVTAEWFAGNSLDGVPCGVIHGDFATWNLLFVGERLSGLLDFEATHWSVLVADFALSWRGYQDEVVRGYAEVRPLSEFERRLIVPVFRAWLFLGLTELPADGVDLEWQVRKLGLVRG